jgi:uncharacterized integral membrane protein
MSEDRPQPVPTQTPQEKQDLSDQLRVAGFVAAAVALALFFLQNLQQVKIHFLFISWETQMIWALILSAALGAVGVFLAMWFNHRRLARKAKERGN